MMGQPQFRGALGMAAPGPEMLGGKRPGVSNPRQPLRHPMSPMIGGLRGMLQLADQQMVDHGPRLKQMRSTFAKGGKVAFAARAIEMVKDALGLLEHGDHVSAVQILRSHPQLRADPEVQKIIKGLSLAEEIEPQPVFRTPREEMGKMNKGGKVEGVRRIIEALKGAIFGESDEPNWGRATALLQKLPGSEGIQQKLGEVHAHYSAPPAPDFDVMNDQDPWNVKNLELITQLEDMIDSVTPGGRIPNPNE